MNILSLFDGISCSRIALGRNKIPITNYFCSEIDKTCIEVSKKHFPDNIFLGDVKSINLKKLPKIDLLIGGSPCQDLSNAFKGSGLKGSRSSLFFEFVRIMEEIKPKYFLLENVRNKWREYMDHEIGVHGIELNSMYFSAQSRPRCYWTNIDVKPGYNENNVCLKDILETNPDKDYFLQDIIQNRFFEEYTKLDTKKKYFGIKKLDMIPRDYIKDNERQRRVYSIIGKSPTILARSDSPKILTSKGIRKLTPLECERLQCIPDNFTDGFSKTQRYKMIGNGFTVSVIEHILKNLKSRKLRQVSLKI